MILIYYLFPYCSFKAQSWEKRLQIATDKDDVDDLCNHAQSQIKLYKERLPKPGINASVASNWWICVNSSHCHFIYIILNTVYLLILF